MSTVKRKSKQLGQILIELGYIKPEQLEVALEEHRKTPKSLGRVLIDLGMIRESDLVRALAEQVGLEFVDLADFQIDSLATSLLPEALARRYRALPIGERDGRLLVAMSDPANVYALDDIRTITGRDVLPVVATANDVEAAIQKYAGMDSQVEAMASIVADASEEDEDTDLEVAVEDAPIVKLVNAIMTQAVGDRASDVHIEPREHDVRIRFRVDGVLIEPMPPAPKNIQNGLISRLKVMADLNIAEKRIPQDGRIPMKVGGKALDLRMATLPTVYGEKVVLRILETSTAMLRLEELGFLEDSFNRFSQSFRKPYGAILVTGPTGSGKSTTMYGTLNILNQIDKNIITVEDPVEYRLAGVNQVQVNVKAGLTFALALRSILRMDPDIVLIGEIRDKETATIAIEAALDRTPRPVLAAHQRRPERHLASGRDGGRDVPGGFGDRRRGRPAPRPQVVRALPHRVPARRERAVRRRLSGLVVARDPGAPEARGVPRMREHGIPRSDRTVRSDADDRRGGTAHGGACICRCHQGCGRTAGDDDAPRRWSGEGSDGPDVTGRGCKGGEVT